MSTTRSFGMLVFLTCTPKTSHLSIGKGYLLCQALETEINAPSVKILVNGAVFGAEVAATGAGATAAGGGGGVPVIGGFAAGCAEAAGADLGDAHSCQQASADKCLM